MTGFPTLLQRHRRALRLSQAALAARTGLSQRHLSYLETGRARPGPRALQALVAALLLDGADAADLLASAAGAVARPGLSWDNPALADVRAVCRALLDRHEPWPGYVTTAGGSVLMANRALDRLLDLAGGAERFWALTAAGGGRNIHDLSFHPEGLAPLLADGARWIPHIVQRLRRAAVHDQEAAATLARVLRYPVVRSIGGGPALPDGPVVAESYLLDGRRISFLAVLTRFGSPGDRMVAGLQMECLVPADAATERLLAATERAVRQDAPASKTAPNGSSASARWREVASS